jgi:alpha-galactosidase
MKKVVDTIHSIDAKARLWWMPLSVYPKTDLFTDHPEYMLLNKDQSPVFIQFWKSFFLCPASEEVQKMTKDFVIKAIKDWGYDGLKIDGNNLNTVPPCYNPVHKHAYPEESIEKLPELYKIIYETALSINPNAVIQICPCGTNQSFHILPYMNQTVASDPHSSWHVRIKGKTLHALTQQKSAFAGDHVELSDNKSDFASTVGIGGVIATKFVWPVGSHENKETGDISLTSDKEKEWAKWIDIYKENMLPKGVYRGELYDIGFNRPEAHAIKKNNTMYYSFYSKEFKGDVELRGLEKRSYQVIDYENNKQLGTIEGPVCKLPVSFKNHLLIKVEPK